MKQKVWPQIFIIYLRYVIGFAFIFASIVKIQGVRFTAESGAENPINSAWHFFETLYQSGIYWKFIGFSQMIAGVLLITQRYAKLGALLFLPIITNIFVITISYDFHGTPIITGLMLVATIILILWDWNTFKVFLNKAPIAENKRRLEYQLVWQITGVIFLIQTILMKLTINEKNIFIWFISFPVTALVGFVLGWQKRKFNSN